MVPCRPDKCKNQYSFILRKKRRLPLIFLVTSTKLCLKTSLQQLEMDPHDDDEDEEDDEGWVDNEEIGMSRKEMEGRLQASIRALIDARKTGPKPPAMAYKIPQSLYKKVDK